MSRYRKIDPRFWKDEKVRTLGPLDKLIAIYGFTGQSNRIGCFTFSPGMGAEDLGLAAETFRERFREVARTLSWYWDEVAGVVYLPTWFRYNQPENTNVLIGNLTDLDDVPKSSLVSLFCNNLAYLAPNHQQTFTRILNERYKERLADVSETSGNSEAVAGAGAVPPFIPPQAGGDATSNGHRKKPRGRSPVAATEAEMAKATELLEELNARAGSDYRAFEAPGRPSRGLSFILARLREYQPWQLRLVIMRQVEEWKNDEKMWKFLRPETLFNKTKCEAYVGQLKMRPGQQSVPDPYANFPRAT